jgi:NhaP-type Na+/H+ or K+/H+ antiporter
MMLPGQNIPYGIRQALDAVESGFNDAFGIPKRRGQ